MDPGVELMHWVDHGLDCMCVLGKATSPVMRWRWPTESCCRRSVASPTSSSLRVRSQQTFQSQYTENCVQVTFIPVLCCFLHAHAWVFTSCPQEWRRATRCPSTCRWWWSWSSPCWPASASEPFTPSWWVKSSARKTLPTPWILGSLRWNTSVNSACVAAPSLQVFLQSLCVRGSWTRSVRCSSQQVGFRLINQSNPINLPICQWRTLPQWAN